MRRILSLCRYSLASMGLGSAPLVASAQGRDLLTALADASGAWHRFFFYVTLALWGLSVWYWSRVLLDAEFAQTKQPYPQVARELPRWLGTFTVLFPAFPIWLAASPARTRALLSLGCVALAAAFHFFVRQRRTYIQQKGASYAVDTFSVSHAIGRTAGRVALISVGVSLVLFGWFVFAPLSAGRVLGAIPIVFIAAANTVFLGSIAVFLSANRRFSIDAVALGAAAVFSFFNDNHRVDVTRSNAALPNLEQMFTDWLGRIDNGRSGGPRAPVFVVAAEGGGIRAAYWTGTVLSDLADRYPAFGNRLFAISGISGGSLGAAVYAALRHDGIRPPMLRAAARAILDRADLLAPTLAKLVTGDLAQWFIPFPVHAFDRSTAIEQAFTAMYQGSAGRQGTFTRSYLDLRVSADAGVPALILNSTGVESGSRVVMAPFAWRFDQIPDTVSYFERAGGAAPRLAPAVHNSARFTYVSPAGVIVDPSGKHRGHVVDGGYFDPSGGDTLIDIVHVLGPIAARAGVEIVPVFITNGRIPDRANRAVLAYAEKRAPTGLAAEPAMNLDTQQQSDGVETTNIALYDGELPGIAILGELFAPVRAVLAARAGHGRVAIGRQRQTPGAIAFGFCNLEEPLRPPLGWQLSAPMMRQLNGFWDKCPVNADGRDALAKFTEAAH